MNETEVPLSLPSPGMVPCESGMGAMGTGGCMTSAENGWNCLQMTGLEGMEGPGRQIYTPPPHIPTVGM